MERHFHIDAAHAAVLKNSIKYVAAIPILISIAIPILAYKILLQ